MKSANFKSLIAKIKMLHFLFYILPLVFLVSGCAAFQVGGEIQAGRRALRYGDPKIALAHFEQAARIDPNYIAAYTGLREGVWTYVGRAHYTLGKLPDARQALERARRHEDDNLAKLYLGLVFARDGDRDRGRREIEAGLRGLGAWLDYIDQNLEDGKYWDPARKIQGEIQRGLAMISGREINWPELIASGEWLGLELETEIDLAKRDKLQDQRDGDKDSDGMP